MDSKTRAALVESIANRIDTFAEHVGYGDPDVTREEATSYIAEIEEALLTDRAATIAEPDAAMVAKFSDDLRAVFVKGAILWAEKDNDYSLNSFWNDVEMAAIAAMPSGKDPNWLDAALDSVDFEVLHLEITHSAPREYGAEIYDHGGNPGFTGYGPTRKAAILDAVQKSKEASNG